MGPRLWWLMRTLHGYLARELLKTFFLTCVALTLLVVLGGGVANIFRGEGVEAGEMLKVFAFLTPVAITLILPVAALFSAAITYGRSASDNEMTACRAAGINIHRLLLSAGLLGFLVTLVTYWSWNYLIPTLSRQIEEVTRRDLPAIVMHQFQQVKPLAFGRYRIMATKCDALDPAVVKGDAATQDYLLLTGVTFLELEDTEMIRYGTSDATLIVFDRTESTPKVTVDLQGVRTFDASRRQYYDLEHQILGPFDIPLPMRRKTKFENLKTLLHYREHPELNPEFEERLYGLRRELMAYYMYQEIAESLRQKGVFELVGPDIHFDVTSKEGSLDADDGRPSLGQVRVVEKSPNGHITYTADRATIEMRSSVERMKPLIMIELFDNVEVRSANDPRVVKKPREALRPVQYMDQPALKAKAESFDPQPLLSRGEIPPLPRKQTRQCEKLLESVAKLKSEVNGEIHFRASYSLTPIAVVLMGAVLGIIVRGGQVLTAFGISCLPSLFVVLSSIVGRNLADRPQYTMASIGIMWGSTVFIYFATAFIAGKVLRR